MTTVPGLNISSKFIGSGFNNSFPNRVPFTANIAPIERRPCTQRQETGSCGCGCVEPLAESDPVVVVDTDNISTADLLKRAKLRDSGKKGRLGINLGDTADILDYTDNELPVDLEILGLQQGDTECRRLLERMRRLPDFVETRRGVFAGNLVNRLLGQQNLQIDIDTFGNIFGGPYGAIIQRRIDQLNGFGECVNNNNYTGTYGAFGAPFVLDNFLVSYTPCLNQSTNSARIYQFSLTEGSDPGDNGLTLTINGQVGRTIYLRRRPEPYYFHFQPQYENCAIVNNPCLNIDICALNHSAFYFTTDPVGGSAASYINNIGNFVGNPYTPPVIGNYVYSGTTSWFVVDDSWPDNLYYQSTYSPFQGGKVVVLDRFGC